MDDNMVGSLLTTLLFLFSSILTIYQEKIGGIHWFEFDEFSQPEWSPIELEIIDEFVTDNQMFHQFIEHKGSDKLSLVVLR